MRRDRRLRQLALLGAGVVVIMVIATGCGPATPPPAGSPTPGRPSTSAPSPRPTTPPPSHSAAPTPALGLDSPAEKEIAMELVSSAENSTLDWKAQYRYVDPRGRTASGRSVSSSTTTRW